MARTIGYGDLVVADYLGPKGERTTREGIVLSIPAGPGDVWYLRQAANDRVVAINPYCSWLVAITRVSTSEDDDAIPF